MTENLAATGAATGAAAVATPHALASASGHQVLVDGGNAVDAALAAAAVLAVVYPNQCAIGGDLIALVGTPDGAVTTINASGRAPRAADPAELRRSFEQVPVDGALAVTVPGVLSGWQELAARWGHRPLSAALSHAATLASDGVQISPGLGRDLVLERERILADPGLAGVLAPGGEVLAGGEMLVQPQLAATLELLAADGVETFYRGSIASSLVAALRAGGSAMTEADFAEHHITVESAPRARFGGLDYYSSGGNTQGGWFLAGLRALEHLAARLGRVPDPLGADAALVAAVLARLARARDGELAGPASRDRGETPNGPALPALGGEAEVGAFVDDILSGQWAAAPVPYRAKATGDTVAVVAADGAGQWVCLIQSVFHAFGSGLLDPATGILMHNRGAAFSLVPGTRGEFRSGARPPHTLMPVLLSDPVTGRVVGAHGTMGGRVQPQIHTHLALHLALGRSPAEAVSAPRWIVGRMEVGTEAADVVQIEADVPDVVQRQLADLGLPVQILTVRDDGVGHTQVVRALTPIVLSAASDPRADGAALAVTP